MSPKDHPKMLPGMGFSTLLSRIHVGFQQSSAFACHCRTMAGITLKHTSPAKKFLIPPCLELLSNAKDYKVLAKGGFCRVQCHAQGDRKYQGYWAQQYVWHSERHSQERHIFLQKPPSKTPFLGS